MNFPPYFLEDIDQEVFKQLPVDIQEEILSGKSWKFKKGKVWVVHYML